MVLRPSDKHVRVCVCSEASDCFTELVLGLLEMSTIALLQPVIYPVIYPVMGPFVESGPFGPIPHTLSDTLYVYQDIIKAIWDESGTGKNTHNTLDVYIINRGNHKDQF